MKTSWHLELFESNSDEFFRMHILHGMDVEKLRGLIVEDEARGVPFGVGAHRVQLAEVPGLAPFIDGEIEVSDAYEYFVEELQY